MVPRVFLLCSGLGRIRRGYEASFQSLYEVLADEPALDLRLYKGGGRSRAREKVLWNLPRRSWLAGRIGEWASLRDSGIGGGYYVEQLTFFLSLLPRLLLGRPDLVYFSDKKLGDLLFHWRRRSGQGFKLLLRNGGPYPPPYRRWDHVQQLSPLHWERAVAAGTPAGQQTLLPTGFPIEAEFEPASPRERESLRRRLGLPTDRPIALSVGSVKSSHKRLDYLIDELAALPRPRPYLVILGQPDAESPAIVRRARQRLGADGVRIDAVPPGELRDHYRAADVFVLASTREGLPRALVEALSEGLPCLAHDCGVMRFVLGRHGAFGDLTQPGVLTGLLAGALSADRRADRQVERHRAAYERFAWDRLRPAYVEMLRRVAGGADRED